MPQIGSRDDKEVILSETLLTLNIVCDIIPDVTHKYVYVFDQVDNRTV